MRRYIQVTDIKMNCHVEPPGFMEPIEEGGMNPPMYVDVSLRVDPSISPQKMQELLHDMCERHNMAMQAIDDL